VVRLVTCLSHAYDRVSMHGVRRQLIADQADALGLPMEFVVIPDHGAAACPLAATTPGAAFPPNDTYTRTMLAAWRSLKGRESRSSSLEISFWKTCGFSGTACSSGPPWWGAIPCGAGTIHSSGTLQHCRTAARRGEKGKRLQ
jgi:hypothetical protein